MPLLWYNSILIVFILSIFSVVIQTLSINARLTYPANYKNQYYQNSTIDSMMSIAKICFPNQMDEFVFVGRYQYFSKWYNKHSNTLPIYLVDLSATAIFNRHQRLKGIYAIDRNITSNNRYPAKIIMVYIEYSLKIILERVKMSLMWNSKAIFLINDHQSNSSCLNVNHVLLEAWQFNILHAIYVCYNEFGIIEYYTFNPFTNFSTEKWMICDTVQSVIEQKNDIITIFKYIGKLNVSEPTICEQLVFDKTHSINGYPIYVAATEKRTMFEYKFKQTNMSLKNSPVLADISGLDAAIFRILESKMGVSLKIKVFNTQGYVDKNNVIHGAWRSIFEHQYDIGINEHYLMPYWRLQTYPHDITTMCALTPLQSHSGTVVMLSVFHPQVMILAAVTTIICAVVFFFSTKLSFVNAFLEILRMLIGVSTQRRSKTFFERLVFLCLITILFEINVYFSSQLTSSFAIKTKSKNIDTLEDLVRSNLTVSAKASYEAVVSENFRERYLVIDDVNDCLVEQQKESIACLCDCFECMYFATMNNSVYISKPLYSFHVVYFVHEDWPFLDRVNGILQTMRECGIIRFEDMLTFYVDDTLHKPKYKTIPEKSVDKRSQKYLVLFYIYTGGLLMATVIFASELLWKCRGLKIRINNN